MSSIMWSSRTQRVIWVSRTRWIVIQVKVANVKFINASPYQIPAPPSSWDSDDSYVCEFHMVDYSRQCGQTLTSSWHSNDWLRSWIPYDWLHWQLWLALHSITWFIEFVTLRWHITFVNSTWLITSESYLICATDCWNKVANAENQSCGVHEHNESSELHELDESCDRGPLVFWPFVTIKQMKIHLFVTNSTWVIYRKYHKYNESRTLSESSRICHELKVSDLPQKHECNESRT